MRWGSLGCGLLIMFGGLSVCLNVFNAFHIVNFVMGISSVLFGFLIAQTVKPGGGFKSVKKWFPFVVPYKGRGCFMIYVGLVSAM
jgi:hypothetical protein